MIPDAPALVAAAALGLPGAKTASVEVEPDDVASVVDAARFHRVEGFLARAVEAEVVSGPSELGERAVAAHHEALVGVVKLEALLVRVALVLDDGGVPFRATKGPAFAHLDYGDTALRSFGDIDLILPTERWDDAVATLADAGYARLSPELRPGFDRQFGKGATLASPDGLELDLHRSFAVGRFGLTVPSHELFEGPDVLHLAGRDIPTLGPALRFLHACYHAALGGFQGVRALRDVAQLILVTEVDWRAAVDAARRWRAEPVVAVAVHDAWTRFGLDGGHDVARWARAVTPTAAERRALRTFRQDRPYREQALTALPVIPGLSSKARYLSALVLPEPGARRGRSALHHVGRSLRLVVRRP